MVPRVSNPRRYVWFATLAGLAAACSDDYLLRPGWPDTDFAILSNGPTLLDAYLAVLSVVDGLVTPTTMAFLGPDNLLVLERNTGRVQGIVEGGISATVLDLAVNFPSERAPLGSPFTRPCRTIPASTSTRRRARPGPTRTC